MRHGPCRACARRTSHSSAAARPTAVVTGASSGIGRATAVAFAEDGANVVLAARGREGLAAMARDCGAGGAEVLVHPADVTDANAVVGLAAAAMERFGAIDVWANLVGVGAIGLFEKVPIEAHRRVIEANLVGHMNGAHAVLGYFRTRRRGTLVNMTSVGGFAPSPYAAAYAASNSACAASPNRCAASWRRHRRRCSIPAPSQPASSRWRTRRARRPSSAASRSRPGSRTPSRRTGSVRWRRS